jgi:zinc protease
MLVALIFIPALLAGQANGKNPTVNFNIDYEKYSLDNGLDVILHKDDSDPIVSVAILFHVGSNREKPGRTGFAHFFEHMLFQDSENVGKGNFFRIIEEMGGEFNGGTWNDGTVYYEVVPKDALERILWMESDRMGFMINTVTTAVLENEKQVVKNEKRQRVDNQPYGHTNYVIDKAIYPEDHPYNWQVIGSLADLEAATIGDVKEFYDKFYGPDNATMVIAGDIDFEQTKKMVDKYFSEIPKRDPIERLTPQPATLKQTVKLMHEDNFAQLPEMRMVWPTVEDGHPDAYALDYLAELLYDGKRAPLYKEIVENRKLASRPVSFNSTLEIAGKFSINIRANAGVDLDEVHNATLAALKQFEKDGIDEKDMERIRNKQETNFYSGISSVFMKSFQLALMNEFRGSPDALEEEIRRILAVTKDDIMRVYRKYIKDRPYVLTSFVPKGMPELAVEGSQVAEVVEEEIVAGAEAEPLPETDAKFTKTPSRINRSTMPALGAPATAKTPTIWKEKLPNGLQALGVENTELPLVEFSLRIKGGMLLEDPAKIGVANLMAQLMQEGTKNKTPEELQDAIGQLGARISFSAGAEFITLQGSCLARNFEKTMALAQEMLLEPRWDEKEFDRIKTSVISQIQQSKGQPNSIGSRIFVRQVYGDDHILANSLTGTEETVAAITLDDLQKYYAHHFSPTVATFHVAGAVSKAQVVKATGSLGQDWKGQKVSLPKLPDPKPQSSPVVYFVDIPDAKQSVLMIGRPTTPGNHDDYFATTVVNHRLGNGTAARLFQKLREERGYTYGAYSSIPRRINTSFFLVSTSVRSNVTKESLQLIKEILEGYKKEYSPEDLRVTQNVLLKGNALAFETLGDKLGILQNISTFGLPMDYIKKEEEVVQSMTLERAHELIAQYMDPENMVYVVVGDAKTQLEAVKELGIGPIIMLDRDGKMVP